MCKKKSSNSLNIISDVSCVKSSIYWYIIKQYDKLQAYDVMTNENKNEDNPQTAMSKSPNYWTILTLYLHGQQRSPLADEKREERE